MVIHVVGYMCAYEVDITHEILPAPYHDEYACTYARACLIPAELLERPALEVARGRRGATRARQRASGRLGRAQGPAHVGQPDGTWRGRAITPIEQTADGAP